VAVQPLGLFNNTARCVRNSPGAHQRYGRGYSDLLVVLRCPACGARHLVQNKVEPDVSPTRRGARSVRREIKRSLVEHLSTSLVCRRTPHTNPRGARAGAGAGGGTAGAGVEPDGRRLPTGAAGLRPTRAVHVSCMHGSRGGFAFQGGSPRG
jgi:hypothetical protein